MHTCLSHKGEICFWNAVVCVIKAKYEIFKICVIKPKYKMHSCLCHKGEICFWDVVFVS